MTCSQHPVLSGTNALIHTSFLLVRAAPAAALSGLSKMPRVEELGQHRAGGSASGHFGANSCTQIPPAQLPVTIWQSSNSSSCPLGHSQLSPSPPLQPHPYNSLSGASAPTIPAYSPFSGLTGVFRTLHLVPKFCPLHILRCHDQCNQIEVGQIFMGVFPTPDDTASQSSKQGDRSACPIP